MFKKALKCLAPIVLSFIVSFPMVKTDSGLVINFNNVVGCRQLYRGVVRCYTDFNGISYVDLDFDNSDLAANEFMAQYEAWLASKGKEYSENKF